MKIIILTQYYLPENGAPQNRLSDLARRLDEMRHEVHILTAMPNYPMGEIFEPYRGKYYCRETIKGVSVLRGWIYASKRREILPRLLNYASFVLSSLIIGVICLPKADFIVTESPPLFLGISGWILSRLKGARFVLNVADLWPKAAVELGVIRNPILISSTTWLESFLYRKAALISGQTRAIVSHVQDRVPQKAVCLLTNGVDLAAYDCGEEVDETLRQDLDLQGKFVVGYGGLHGPAQALHTAVQAGLHLADSPDIVIAFFGDGPTKDDLRRRADELQLQNIRFFPMQPRDLMPSIMRLWDVSLVSLCNGTIMKGALPSKMFEGMGAGLPIILSAPHGEASVVIKSADSGEWVPADKPVALAQAIMKLHKDAALRKRMGRNARRYVRLNYNRQVIAEQFQQDLLNMDCPDNLDHYTSKKDTRLELTPGTAP